MNDMMNLRGEPEQTLQKTNLRSIPLARPLTEYLRRALSCGTPSSGGFEARSYVHRIYLRIHLLFVFPVWVFLRIFFSSRFTSTFLSVLRLLLCSQHFPFTGWHGGSL